MLSRNSGKDKQSNAGSVWNSQDYSNHLGFPQRWGGSSDLEMDPGIIQKFEINLAADAMVPLRTVKTHRLVANQ